MLAFINVRLKERANEKLTSKQSKSSQCKNKKKVTIEWQNVPCIYHKLGQVEHYPQLSEQFFPDCICHRRFHHSSDNDAAEKAPSSQIKTLP